MASTDGDIEQRYRLLSSRLDERQRRLFVAAEAMVIGRGGISAVSRATGVSRGTITVGLGELEAEAVAESVPLPQGRVRRLGGDRKKLAQTDPTLLSDLELLIDPVTRGDLSRRCAGPARVCGNWPTNCDARASSQSRCRGRVAQSARLQPAGQRQDA